MKFVKHVLYSVWVVGAVALVSSCGDRTATGPAVQVSASRVSRDSTHGKAAKVGGKRGGLLRCTVNSDDDEDEAESEAESELLGPEGGTIDDEGHTACHDVDRARRERRCELGADVREEPDVVGANRPAIAERLPGARVPEPGLPHVELLRLPERERESEADRLYERCVDDPRVRAVAGRRGAQRGHR